jgi:hypothetical protein
MEVWTIVPAVWLTTVAMCVGRTYPLISKMLETTPGGELIVDYKYIHMITYMVCMFVISPFCWQIAFFDEPRQKFVVSYVHAIVRNKT